MECEYEIYIYLITCVFAFGDDGFAGGGCKDHL